MIQIGEKEHKRTQETIRVVDIIAPVREEYFNEFINDEILKGENQEMAPFVREALIRIHTFELHSEYAPYNIKGSDLVAAFKRLAEER